LWAEGKLYFGGPPWQPFGAGAELYELPQRPLPGSGAEAPSAAAAPSGEDAARVYALPGRGDASSTYFATYGRIALGFDRGRGLLAWVKALPGRILAATATDRGLVLCDQTGFVQVLGARDGRQQRLLRLVSGRTRGAASRPAACSLGPGELWLDAAEHAA